MKKITKLFVVILSAASLSFSAFAGELSVTGGATATIKQGGNNTGKGLGVSNELDFTATGELDNGYAWKWQTQLDNAAMDNDDTRLEVTTPYGKVGMYISENDISTKLKYGVGAMGTGSDYAGPATVQWGATMNSYNNIGYVTPADLLPLATKISFAFAPRLQNAAGSSAKANGAVVTDPGPGEQMAAVAINMTPIDGLSIGGDVHDTSGGDGNSATESAGIYAKYAVGPYTAGYAQTRYQPQQDLRSNWYETHMVGIQMAVNDALSVSYNREMSALHTNKVNNLSAATAVSDEINMDINHYQVAYVIGGATLGIARADANDSDYLAGNKQSSTTLSMSMAF